MPKILVVNAAEAAARLETLFGRSSDCHLESTEDRDQALFRRLGLRFQARLEVPQPQAGGACRKSA
jgi:hypothetical protein